LLSLFDHEQDIISEIRNFTQSQ